jgi:hypothetical protein
MSPNPSPTSSDRAGGLPDLSHPERVELFGPDDVALVDVLAEAGLPIEAPFRGGASG